MSKIDKRTKEYKEWKRNQESKGLGDIVEKITEVTGVKKVVDSLTDDCGCNDRKKNWNNIRLFKKNINPRCLTKEENEDWKSYRDNQKWRIEGLKLYNDDIEYIWKTYQSLFRVKVSKPCSNCSPKPLMYMLDAIDTLYKESDL